MTWLVWRRLRVPLSVALGLVALVGITAVAARFGWTAAAQARGVVPCLAQVETGVCATEVWFRFREALYGFYTWFSLFLVALPGVTGASVGAGLFGGELGRGTHVFALSQSASRLRWFGHGLLAAGLPVAVALALLTPVAAWWARPFAGVVGISPLRVDVFLTTGLAPAVYAILAFCVAAAAGLLLRSTFGALGLALAVQVGVLFLTSFTLRPAYLPPERDVQPFTFAQEGALVATAPDGLYVDTGYVDAQGRTLDFTEVNALPCAAAPDYLQCLRDAGIVGTYTDYHPVTRYWPFQAIESAIVLGIAAAALGAGLWGLRRRVH